jgi:hypothetical protein
MITNINEIIAKEIPVWIAIAERALLYAYDAEIIDSSSVIFIPALISL